MFDYFDVIDIVFIFIKVDIFILEFLLLLFCKNLIIGFVVNIMKRNIY